MKKQEMLKIVSLICLSYPNVTNDETKIRNMTEMWFENFKNDDGNKVLLAVKEHIVNNKFIPTIADVKERMKPKMTAFGDNCYDTLADERLSRGLPEKISVR